MSGALPRMLRIRQNFPRTGPLNIAGVIERELAEPIGSLKRGSEIAVAVGSRGISHLATVVKTALDCLRQAGMHPFILPAMGSHGGGTPDGQRDVLASYGITEVTMGAAIRASMEVEQVGTSEAGMPVYCSVEALRSSAILLINRIKPHTDFFGLLGSGLQKMSVIGLGKHKGAAAMHVAATRIGHERAIRGMAGVMLRRAPVMGGLAILENQFHDTARIEFLAVDEILDREESLLQQARKLMPGLPFEEVDLLIVDEIGKNVSGAGMDPNVIGRSVDGYTSTLINDGSRRPFIRRIFVRGLTAETHGNGIGIGMADATTARLVESMNPEITNINALTAMTPQSAKIPIAFGSDREAIEKLLTSLALEPGAAPRVVRIANTLELDEMEVSEAYEQDLVARGDLEVLGGAVEVMFDIHGDLSPMRRV